MGVCISVKSEYPQLCNGKYLVPIQNTVKITVKKINGDAHSSYHYPNNTIEDVKKVYQEQSKIPSVQQKLVIAGHCEHGLVELIDTQKTIREYGIVNGTILLCIIHTSQNTDWKCKASLIEYCQNENKDNIEASSNKHNHIDTDSNPQQEDKKITPVIDTDDYKQQLSAIKIQLEQQKDLILQLQASHKKSVRSMVLEINGLKKEIVALKKKNDHLNVMHDENKDESNITTAILSNKSLTNKNNTNNEAKQNIKPAETNVNECKSSVTEEVKMECIPKQTIPNNCCKDLMGLDYINKNFEHKRTLRSYLKQITRLKSVKTYTITNNSDSRVLCIFGTNIANLRRKVMYLVTIDNKMIDLLSAEQIKEQYSIDRNKLPIDLNQIYNYNESFDKSKIVPPVKAPKQINTATTKNGNQKVIKITEMRVIDCIFKAIYDNTPCFSMIMYGKKKKGLPILINPSDNEYMCVIINDNNIIEGISGDWYQIETCVKLSDVTSNIKSYTSDAGPIILLQLVNVCHGYMNRKSGIINAYDPNIRDYVRTYNVNQKDVKNVTYPVKNEEFILVYFQTKRNGNPFNMYPALITPLLQGKFCGFHVSEQGHKWGLIEQNETGTKFVFSECDVIPKSDRIKIKVGLSVQFYGINHPNPYNKYKNMAVTINIKCVEHFQSPNAINASYISTNNNYNSLTSSYNSNNYITNWQLHQPFTHNIGSWTHNTLNVNNPYLQQQQ